MNNLRIFFVGGVIAYRALFNWLNPWIFIPTLVFAPIFQVLFFAFLGRSAGLESDRRVHRLHQADGGRIPHRRDASGRLGRTSLDHKLSGRRADLGAEWPCSDVLA